MECPYVVIKIIVKGWNVPMPKVEEGRLYWNGWKFLQVDFYIGKKVD